MSDEPVIGRRVTIFGGYDHEPKWLRGERSSVAGASVAWVPGQNEQPACVVELDEPLTAEGDVRGTTSTVTGRYVVLELRYTGQRWDASGTVHVELCEHRPGAVAWADRSPGAWVESHATYQFAG